MVNCREGWIWKCMEINDGVLYEAISELFSTEPKEKP
jgi:hypothetical protein